MQNWVHDLLLVWILDVPSGLYLSNAKPGVHDLLLVWILDVPSELFPNVDFRHTEEPTEDFSKTSRLRTQI
jgi:hypothetical protein